MTEVFLPYLSMESYSRLTGGDSKKTSDTQEKIEKQKRFLINIAMTRAKFQNPISENSEDGTKGLTDIISQISQLEQIDIQHRSMEESNLYNKLTFKSGIVGKNIVIPADNLRLSSEGLGKISCQLNSDPAAGDSLRFIVYDNAGNPLLSQMVPENQLQGMRQGIQNLEVLLSPENLAILRKSGVNRNDLRYNIFIKKSGDESETRLKTYDSQQVEAVFIDDEQAAGSENDFVVTERGAKVGIRQIMGFAQPFAASAKSIEKPGYLGEKESDYSLVNGAFAERGQLVSSGANRYADPEQRIMDEIHNRTLDIMT